MTDGFDGLGSVALRVTSRDEKQNAQAQYDELHRRMYASVGMVDAMSPVERALLHVDQMQSFVRGHNSDAVFGDPLSVLAAEVRRLQQVLRDEETSRKAAREW